LHIEEDIVKDYIGEEDNCSVLVTCPPREEAEEDLLKFIS